MTWWRITWRCPAPRYALVAEGPPEHVAAVLHSWTGHYLKSVLETRELALA